MLLLGEQTIAGSHSVFRPPAIALVRKMCWKTAHASWRAAWAPFASLAPRNVYKDFHSVSRKQFQLLSPSNLQDFLELFVLKRWYFFPKLLILICNQSTMSPGTVKRDQRHLSGDWVKGVRWILTAWLIKGKSIVKRKWRPDSLDGSCPWNFIGESWISKCVWEVNIKNT